jgi:hypothetical protein
MMGMLGAMADFAAAGRQHFQPPGATPAAQRPSGPDEAAASLLLPIGHAMMIAANSSFSYWLGLAQILESHQTKLAEGVGVIGAAGPDPAGRGAGLGDRVAADELRALLREVGDLATREARLLKNELNSLDETVAQSLQQTDPSSPYRRRWRSKA